MGAFQNIPNVINFGIKLLILVVIALGSLVQLNAQMLYSFNPPNASRTAHAQYIRNLNQKIDPGELVIEGSPYLNESFVAGNVYSSIGNFFDVEMRYHIHLDYMEFKEKGQLYALDPNILVNKIKLEDQTFVVDFFEEKGAATPMYLIRLDSGKVTLMAKKRVLFKDQQLGKPIEGDIPASYSHLPDAYYFKIENGPLELIRSVKKLIAALPDRNKKLEEFAKQEKILSKDPEDLVRLIRYYNSLE